MTKWDETMHDYYHVLVDQNQHTEAAILLAVAFGTEFEVTVLEQIKFLQDRQNEIFEDQLAIRDAINRRCFNKLIDWKREQI